MVDAVFYFKWAAEQVKEAESKGNGSATAGASGYTGAEADNDEEGEDNSGGEEEEGEDGVGEDTTDGDNAVDQNRG